MINQPYCFLNFSIVRSPLHVGGVQELPPKLFYAFLTIFLTYCFPGYVPLLLWWTVSHWCTQIILRLTILYEVPVTWWLADSSAKYISSVFLVPQVGNFDVLINTRCSLYVPPWSRAYWMRRPKFKTWRGSFYQNLATIVRVIGESPSTKNVIFLIWPFTFRQW